MRDPAPSRRRAGRWTCRSAAALWAAAWSVACAGHGARPAESASAAPRDDRAYLAGRSLMVPVAGVRPDQVPDTYREPRSGGRVHRALDILAPRGTPVVSADAGRVLRLRRNAAGGITIYAVDPGDRIVYYYAHLDRYAPRLTEGQQVARGQVIGYVGTTGNAPANVPHLHFQVMRRPNAARWWDGDPIDPKPFLVLPGKATG